MLYERGLYICTRKIQRQNDKMSNERFDRLGAYRV